MKRALEWAHEAVKEHPQAGRFDFGVEGYQAGLKKGLELASRHLVESLQNPKYAEMAQVTAVLTIADDILGLS